MDPIIEYTHIVDSQEVELHLSCIAKLPSFWVNLSAVVKLKPGVRANEQKYILQPWCTCSWILAMTEPKLWEMYSLSSVKRINLSCCKSTSEACVCLRRRSSSAQYKRFYMQACACLIEILPAAETTVATQHHWRSVEHEGERRDRRAEVVEN